MSDMDQESAQVRWERRQMMLQMFGSLVMLWRCRHRKVWRVAAAIVLIGDVHAVFGGTNGIVQSFGPVFWYHGKIKRLGGSYTERYTMRKRIEWRSLIEESCPFRVGKGVAIRIGRKMYMVGYCKRRPPQSDWFAELPDTLEWMSS